MTTIAVIGTGTVGGALTRRLMLAGHDVVVTSTSPDKARALADETGARAVTTNLEAVEAAGIVIGAVPFASFEQILTEVDSALDGTILVDVSNRMPVDGEPGLAIDGTSNAEMLQEWAPGAKVVKAFNTLLASRQAQPDVQGVRADAHVASDHGDARRAMLDVVASAGFTPVDTGPLSSARVLEAMGVLNIWLNLEGGSWQSTWKLLEPAA